MSKAYHKPGKTYSCSPVTERPLTTQFLYRGKSAPSLSHRVLDKISCRGPALSLL